MDDIDLQGLHCGKTEESKLVKIGKTTSDEHASTSVQLKENKENYEASVVQVNVVEPHILRQKPINEEDRIVRETADNKGKTEESKLVKIGKTTSDEHVSTSVQLKENEENKENYEASVRTTEWNETKHGMNVPYEVLTKCCYFVADPSSKMAASRGLTVQVNVVEPHIRKQTLNEEDIIVRETADDKGKTEESKLVKIGKTTSDEHVSTSVQLKENEENKENYEASVVQVNIVEPHIRKQTLNGEDRIVRETADDTGTIFLDLHVLAGQHAFINGKRKVQVSKKICRKNPTEIVQWIITLIQNLPSIQRSKLIIWIILGFLFPVIAGSVHYHKTCTGIDLKVTSKENFIVGGSSTFSVKKKCMNYGMTAAPNGKVVPIVTNGIVEDDYLNLVTSEVGSTEKTITIKTLTSSNLTTVYQFTCGFDCEQTKRLSQYSKGNGANGITYNMLLIWLCCLLTCLSWIMH